MRSNPKSFMKNWIRQFLFNSVSFTALKWKKIGEAWLSMLQTSRNSLFKVEKVNYEAIIKRLIFRKSPDSVIYLCQRKMVVAFNLRWSRVLNAKITPFSEICILRLDSQKKPENILKLKWKLRARDYDFVYFQLL